MAALIDLIGSEMIEPGSPWCCMRTLAEQPALNGYSAVFPQA